MVTGACGLCPGHLRSILRTVRFMSRDTKRGLLNESVPVTPPQTCKRKTISSSCRTPSAKARRPLVPPVAESAQEHTAFAADAFQVPRERALGSEDSEVRVLEIPKYDTKAEVVEAQSGCERNAWLVYLLLSCDRQKTYVGVTSDLLRRLKQHNGELRGGAKSCRAGRPWEVVCKVQGFSSKSEAFRFECAWKAASKKARRSLLIPGESSRLSSELNLAPVMRRQAALETTVASMAFPKELEIDWQPQHKEKLPTTPLQT